MSDTLEQTKAELFDAQERYKVALKKKDDYHIGLLNATIDILQQKIEFERNKFPYRNSFGFVFFVFENNEKSYKVYTLIPPTIQTPIKFACLCGAINYLQNRAYYCQSYYDSPQNHEILNKKYEELAILP